MLTRRYGVALGIAIALLALAASLSAPLGFLQNVVGRFCHERRRGTVGVGPWS